MSEPNFWDTISGPRNPDAEETGELPFTLFGYAPSLAFAVVGLVAFSIVSIPQLWYTIRRRNAQRTFHALMLAGCLTEVAGYAARTYATFNIFQVGGYSAQFLLLILAPVLFTAAIDMTLNVMVRDFPNTDCLLLLRPRTVLIIFVTTDVICIFVQLAGGALFGVSAGGDSDSGVSVDTATNILMAGLILQIISWVIFIAFLLVAVYRSYQYKKYPHLAHHTYNPMRWLLLTLTAVTVLIFWRACYRTAESAAGYIGGPLSREDLFSTNDFLPVILATIIFTIAPPFRFTEYAIAKGLHEDHRAYAEPQVPAASTELSLDAREEEKRSSPSHV